MWWLKGTDDGKQNQEASDDGVDNAALVDMKEQFEQQQQLIQQLKDLLRLNEDKLKKKDEELEETSSKLSKLNIQYKAKVAQLNKQFQTSEKKNSPSSPKTKNADDANQETTNTDSNRGKILMLKKQLDDNKSLFEKRIKEMADSKTTVEQALESLSIKLQERDDIITHLKAANNSISSNSNHVSETSNNGDNQANTDINEMYAQIVYKDSKILELDQRILELERNMMDLQENLKEKDEVIQTRNKAIQLMTEDLNRRGKAVVDQLDDTRDQMKFMQENFASAETQWKEEKQKLFDELTETKERMHNIALERDKSIAELKASLSKLEGVRFDLSARNAELQEKVVRLQDSIQKLNSKNGVDNSDSDHLQNEVARLVEELKGKEAIISDLQSAGDHGKSANQKVLKLKAQHKSQLKALESQIKELKNCNNTSDHLKNLESQIVELEKEKSSMQLKLIDYDDLVNLKVQNQQLIQELKHKLQLKSDDLDNHLKIISALEKNKLDLAEQLAENNKSIELLKMEKQAAEEEMSELRSHKAILEKKLLGSDKSSKGFENLVHEVEDLKLKLEQENQCLIALEGDKHNFEGIVDDLNETVIKLNASLEVAKNEANTLKEELNLKNQKIQHMEDELYSSRINHEEVIKLINIEVDQVKRGLEEENASLKAEKDHLNTLIKEKDHSLEKLSNDIGSLIRDKEILSMELSEGSQLNANKDLELENLRKELTVVKEHKESEKYNLECSIRSLSEQLNDLEAKCHALLSDKSETEALLSALSVEKNDAIEEKRNWELLVAFRSF